MTRNWQLCQKEKSSCLMRQQQAKKNAAEAAFKLGDPSMKSHFSQDEA